MGNCAGCAAPQRQSYRQVRAHKPYLMPVAKSQPQTERQSIAKTPPKVNDMQIMRSPSPDNIRKNPSSKFSTPNSEIWKAPLLSRTIKTFTKPLTMREEEVAKESNTFEMHEVPIGMSSTNRERVEIKNEGQDRLMRVQSLEDSIFQRKNMSPDQYHEKYKNQQLYDSPSEIKEINEIFGSNGHNFKQIDSIIEEQNQENTPKVSNMNQVQNHFYKSSYPKQEGSNENFLNIHEDSIKSKAHIPNKKKEIPSYKILESIYSKKKRVIKQPEYNHFNYDEERVRGSADLLELMNESLEVPYYVKTIKANNGEDVRYDNFERVHALNEFQMPETYAYMADVFEG